MADRDNVQTEAHKQRLTHTEKQPRNHADIQTNKQTTDIHAYKQTHKQTYIHAYIHTIRHTYRQTNVQTYRQLNQQPQ